MSIDIGRVFSNTLKMVQERWLSMIALWATFIGFLFVFGIAVFAVIGGTMMAVVGSASDPAVFSDPATMGSLGGGLIVMLIVVYFGYIAIALGQNAALVAAASPLHRLSFGEAFGRGLKGGLTLLGVMVLFIIAYIVLLLVLMLVGLILSFLGELAGIVLAIVLIPAAIYISCRFSMIIPVIVVEKLFNPITAINRSWQITSGKVLGIFITLIAFAVLAAVVVVPMAMLMVGTIDAAATGAEPGIGSVLFFFLGMLVLSFAFLLSYSALIASLHAEMSDTQAVEFGKTFE